MIFTMYMLGLGLGLGEGAVEIGANRLAVVGRVCVARCGGDEGR